MKFSTKVIAQTGLLLAICIASQFMKNISVYITGPIINIAIVLAVLMIGLGSGVLLGMMTPVTAFLIAPSPIMMGIPLVIPCIMMGNVLLAVSIWVVQKKIRCGKMKEQQRVAVGMGIGTALKAAFMGSSIVLVLLPLYGGNIKVPAEKLKVLMETAKITFSVTQLITAGIGCMVAYVIWLRLRSVKNNSEIEI